VPFPVKTKLWVRDFMPKSDQKHYKTTLESLQKKRGSLASCYSL